MWCIPLDGRLEVGNMVNIMMIEADTAILQEVIMFLSGKGQCRITNLSLPEENGCVLTFSWFGNSSE